MSYIKLNFFPLLIIFLLTNSVSAETLSGSTYTMEGGMVYQSENVNGSTYSLSASGEPIVGSSNGSSFSQNGGVFNPPPSTTASASGSQSSGSRGSLVKITAYSYVGQTLTFIAESYPISFQNVFLLDKDGKKIEPTRVNSINDKGLYIIVFEKVPTGDFNLHFSKGSIFLFNKEENIFSINVTKEGSGIVNGPDSSILNVDGELKTDLEKNGATIENIETTLKPKRSVEIQAVENKDDETCNFFNLSCLSYIKIYILLISYFFVAYAIFRLIKSIVLRIFK